MSPPASSTEVKTEPVQKNETPEHQLIPLTDKTLVTILIAHDCTYTYHKGAGKTFFYFDPKQTHELREAWKLNKPIPITDVRKIYQALDSFHSAVRDY
jgi:hypothetical protein